MSPESHGLAERYFQKSYIDYTRKQEAVTPQLQRLLKTLRSRFGSLENIPADVRQRFHDASLRVIKWNGLLTFNFREAWLFLFCFWFCSFCFWHVIFPSVSDIVWQ